jgi:hypothetical protein
VPYMRTAESYQESYKQRYAIQVFVRSLEDGTFNAHGWIRHAVRNPTLLNDLPFVDKFDTQEENYRTPDAALQAGMSLAKKRIDDLK